MGIRSKLPEQYTNITMHQIILTTCPDRETAENIALKLLESKLAACINILPAMTSIYLWQGDIETAREHLLLIKSRKDKYADLENLLRKLHPYELPEIVAVSIDHGLPDYLKWIDSCLATH